MSQLFKNELNIFLDNYSYQFFLFFVITILSTENPSREAIVMLHGWGANSKDLVPLADEIGKDHYYLFPEGPFDVPDTGGEGKGWFTFPLTEEFAREKQQSREQIFQVLDRLKLKGVAPEKTFLFGFSQGASMSLDVAMHYPSLVAGVVVLSGFLMDQEKLSKRGDLPLRLPIFWGHGLYDPLIPIDLGRQSYQTLVDLGFHVEWHEYPMAHQISQKEIEDVRQFIFNCHYLSKKDS